MIGRLGVCLVGLRMIVLSLAGVCLGSSGLAAAPADVGSEEAFRHAVEVAFKTTDRSANALLCQPPETGRGLFGAFDPSAIRRVLIVPLSAQTRAFNEKDHFRRFDEAAYQLSICLETPKMKEICIVRPVLRRDGALCVQ